jgi:hypothetical protein
MKVSWGRERRTIAGAGAGVPPITGQDSGGAPMTGSEVGSSSSNSGTRARREGDVDGDGRAAERGATRTPSPGCGAWAPLARDVLYAWAIGVDLCGDCVAQPLLVTQQPG